MADTLPRAKDAQVNFFADRAEAWQEHAAAIGLEAGEVAAFVEDEVNAAAEAVEAARVARQAAMTATAEADAAVARMLARGRGFIGRVQATAKTAERPADVYALASLPAPRPRSRRGVPEQPVNPRAQVSTYGRITLLWDGVIEGRAWHEIERRVTDFCGRETDWHPVGTAAERAFTDPGLPAGGAAARYRVRGVNPRGPGPWSQITGVELTAIERAPEAWAEARAEARAAKASERRAEKPVETSAGKPVEQPAPLAA